MALQATLKSTEDLEVILSCLDAVATLGTKGQIQQLLETGLIGTILALANDEKYTNIIWKIIGVLRSLSTGSLLLVDYLANNGAIRLLVENLKHFKTYDRVIAQLYGVFMLFSILTLVL